MTCCISRCARALLVASVAVSALSGQGGFLPGDLYLHSPGLTASGGRLTRIRPFSGATHIAVNYALTPAFPAMASYDPYRDRIVACAGIGTTVTKLYSI